MTKPCANPACHRTIERPAWRFRRAKHPACSIPCRRIVLAARTGFKGRFLRGGIWWAKLRPDDHSYGWGDARGYYPEHILVTERLLGRRIAGDERVRWLSANKMDTSPRNLVLSATLTHTLVASLVSPQRVAATAAQQRNV